jgi:hypothetical protein
MTRQRAASLKPGEVKMNATSEIRYRRFDIACNGGKFVVKTWRGEVLASCDSLVAARAEIDRIMKGSNHTDAAAYGSPV